MTREGRGGTYTALDPAFLRETIISSRPVDDVKAWVVLIEPYFKVRSARSARISRAPFNVKSPVGRDAGD